MLLCFRLSVQRLRTLQQKKEAQAKASRRDIATLIERGKIETARIKVETSMSSHKYQTMVTSNAPVFAPPSYQ